MALFFGLYEVGRRHTLALLACPSPGQAVVLCAVVQAAVRGGGAQDAKGPKVTQLLHPLN